MSDMLTDEINHIQKIINKTDSIKLLKHMVNHSEVIMNLYINNNEYKIITDFNNYCMAESKIDTNSFNIKMVLKNKKPKIIIDELLKISSPKNDKLITKDPFHIFNKFEECTKIVIDYKKYEKVFINNINNNNKNKSNNKVPKGLLLSSLQICQLIINEIKSINRNYNYDHYIFVDMDNPYSLIVRLKFKKNSVIDIFKKLDYDYMEFRLNIDPLMHPYMPPKLEYIKPKIKTPLLLSLINLDILRLDKWNPIITLEYLITQIGDQLEELICDYIVNDGSLIFNNLEYELIKLSSINKDKYIFEDLIKINVPKLINTNNQSQNYWKSGTGYGNDGNSKWDIKAYIQNQELYIDEIISCLMNLYNIIDLTNINDVYDSILIKYINEQLNSFSLLELEKNNNLYKVIFDILGKCINININQNIINYLYTGFKKIYDELIIFFDNEYYKKDSSFIQTTTLDNIKFSDDKQTNAIPENELILEIYCLSDWFLSRYNEQINIESCENNMIISSDKKEEYCNLMKTLQFGTYQLPSYHRFIKYKGIKPEQKALLRIISEISSLKSGLPLNWESTIWVRVPKESINIFSFIISGPKDTPYENGLFEFHAFLPFNYPNEVPQVLLHTTGNDKVRFNPNLYDNGKVCLSLLGTWSGQSGETWNPKTSTFLQVLVSIQSLILVEEPYFNEPGYEKSINTAEGKRKSEMYNKERYPSTIQLAMIDMINKPPIGFEDVVNNHFRMKKEEIINTTQKWLEKSDSYKSIIEEKRNELINLLKIYN